MKILSVSLRYAIMISSQIAFAQVPGTEMTASDGATGDYFGFSVSISGDRAIVGAVQKDDNHTNSGAAYIFRRDGSSWIQESKLTPSDSYAFKLFGHSVAIAGDYAVIGADQNRLGGDHEGSAYIFRLDGLEWVEEAKLTASDAGPFDLFGNSVSISGDRVIIGAYEADNWEFWDDAGAAYIFRREGTEWIEEAKLIAIHRNDNDYFGTSVSISGDYAVVGVPYDDDIFASSGSAYVFKLVGGDWVADGKLLAGDAGYYDYLGESVSISGNRAIVGAKHTGDGGINSGSAYVFVNNGVNWVQEAKLIASDDAFDDFFGCAVSISGDYAIVGAYGDNGIGLESGAAYVFRRDRDTWVEHAKFTFRDGGENDSFGCSVSIEGDQALVGAYLGDHDGIETGAAHVYSGFSALSVSMTLTRLVGRAFEYDLTMTNTSKDSLNVDIWTTMYGPYFPPLESRQDEKIGRVILDRTLGSGKEYSESGEYELGERAPVGTYLFTVNVGEYPDFIMASRSQSYTLFSADKPLASSGWSSPSVHSLLANHPNPFNPSTTISYAISADTYVELKIYNMLGQAIKTLVDGYEQAGYKEVRWDGRDQSGARVAGGIYIYRMTAGAFTVTKRMLLLK